MRCPYCKEEAVFISNKSVYGKRYGRSHMIWFCKNCDAYVGVHENDPARPKGTMAKQSLRIMRIRAHNSFDKLWKSGLMTRTEAYEFLSNRLGVKNIHIGESDNYMCIKIIRVVREFLKEE